MKRLCDNADGNSWDNNMKSEVPWILDNTKMLRWDERDSYMYVCVCNQ